MADKFGRPEEGEYKVITISILGLVTETFYRGWNAETAADQEHHRAKENKGILYVMTFHGQTIRSQHPAFEVEVEQ